MEDCTSIINYLLGLEVFFVLSLDLIVFPYFVDSSRNGPGCALALAHFCFWLMQFHELAYLKVIIKYVKHVDKLSLNIPSSGRI